MSATIRSDLYFGALYGLSLSAAVWTLVLAPPARPWGALALLPIALTAGALVTRSRRLGPLSPVYPLAVAGAWIAGPSTSLVAASLAAAASRLLSRSAGSTSPRRGFALELSGIAISSCLAALGFQLARTALEASGILLEIAGALAAHGVLWSVSQRLLGRLAVRFERGNYGPRHARRIGRPAVSQVLGAIAGSAIALVWTSPEGPYLLMSTSILVLAATTTAGRLNERRAKRRAELENAALCAAMVGSLSRLVEARDAGTLEHLRRVQRLCLEVAARLGLSSADLEALSAAALLHDVGKLAVPEGILSKPGRLTTQEMARMRVHPEVGARVLEAIPFPYPLAPIVRHHHERWDGEGYPAGLRGEEIPIGARILAAVDSFDALTTDRPYRRAISREQALAFLEQEAGQTFDPEVVETLIDYLETDEPYEPDQELGPTLVLESTRSAAERRSSGGSLPRSQRELELLYEIARTRKRKLDLDDYLTLVSSKLRRHIPHASCVVYVLEPHESMLHARFATGEAADALSALAIPLGERLSGWAALQRRAFVGHDHRSPIDRDGCRSDLEDCPGAVTAALGSTLVAPMVLDERTVGALALYDAPERRFTPEERRLLVRIAGYVAQVIDHPDLHGNGEARSLTDPLTGVPNASFLRHESTHRIARHDESGEGFGLLAFRVSGLEQVGERLGCDEADRLLCHVARRFAASCSSHETLVRFGQELFIVLSSTAGSGELVERWHDLRNDVEHPPITTSDDSPSTLRLSAAHAMFPADGQDLDELLDALDARLSLAEQRRIVPFRPALAASRRGRTA